jgi:hypothetical protein
MRGLLAINEACELLAGALWIDYTSAKAKAPGIDFFVLGAPMSVEEGRRLRFKKAKATLDTWLCGCLRRREYVLWARRNDRMAELKAVPVSAVCTLKFNYEQQTAVGDGLPPLYDLHIRMPVKRWCEPPSADVLKSAALAVAKRYEPADPPTEAEWKEALEAKLGGPVTYKVARETLHKWASHLRRQRGQKPNRQS